MIVAELERALLARYPKTDTEPWDHVGLSVGDPAAEITGVACALDAMRLMFAAPKKQAPTCC